VSEQVVRDRGEQRDARRLRDAAHQEMGQAHAAALVSSQRLARAR
jgi:hypothetical protein